MWLTAALSPGSSCLCVFHRGCPIFLDTLSSRGSGTKPISRASSQLWAHGRGPVSLTSCLTTELPSSLIFCCSSCHPSTPTPPPPVVLNSANQSHHSSTYWANPLSSFDISHHPLCSSSSCSSPLQFLQHFLTCCSLCLKCASLRSAFCHLVLRFFYCILKLIKRLS